MAEKANYQISNYEAAAQLGALAGKIQALLIIEPIPSPEDFLRIILALETLSELCQDFSTGIKEVIAGEQH